MKAQMVPENIQRDTVVVPANNISDEIRICNPSLLLSFSF